MKSIAREVLAKNRGKSIAALWLPVLVYLVAFGIPFGLFFLTESFIFFVLIFILVVAWVPVIIGIFRFYYEFKDDPDTDLKVLLKGHENFLGNLGRLFQAYLFMYLWTLLLIIPGIVAGFSYVMVPFILGDDEIKRDALSPRPTAISREMMKGHRLEFFVLILSFLGWMIVGTLTLHILTVVFVGPYIYQTMAVFYEKVRKNLPEKYFVKETAS